MSAFSLGERKPRLVERKVRSGSEKLMKAEFPGMARLADGSQCPWPLAAPDASTRDGDTVAAWLPNVTVSDRTITARC